MIRALAAVVAAGGLAAAARTGLARWAQALENSTDEVYGQLEAQADQRALDELLDQHTALATSPLLVHASGTDEVLHEIRHVLTRDLRWTPR